MLIKQLCMHNVDDVTQLALQLWPNNEFLEMKQEYVEILDSSRDAVYVALVDGQYIGFIQMSLRVDYVEGSHSSPVGYIEGIYVNQSYRKQGISRKLVEAGEAWARSQGCSELASDTELANISSQQFHQKLGFTEAGRIVSYIKGIDRE